MGDAIHVDPAALALPATRFDTGAAGLSLMAAAVRQAASMAAGAAGNPLIAAAADVFGPAVGAVVEAFSGECSAMAGKLRQAGVVYAVTDETAIGVRTVEVPIDGRRGSHPELAG